MADRGGEKLRFAVLLGETPGTVADWSLSPGRGDRLQREIESKLFFRFWYERISFVSRQHVSMCPEVL